MLQQRGVSLASMVGAGCHTAFRATAFALLCIGAPITATATTYYVDAVGGSDSAAGTTTATAWKTLTKVDATTFLAGDRILFHTGQSWAGQVHPLGSGAAGNPILLSSYGSGALPIVDGSSLSGGGAIYLSNQAYWTIDGFEVVSNSGVNNVGTTTTPGVNRSGILVDNSGGTTLAGITIRNNHVHNVNGCFVCNGADAHANGGIAVLADSLAPLSHGSSSWNGVTISNNYVADVGRTGIVFDDNSTGFLYFIDTGALSNNVVIHGNTLNTIDSDGIIVAGSQNNTIDHNVVGNAGLVTVANSTEPSAAGIWPAKTNNTIVEYNEVFGVLTQQNVDGQGFDVDLGASNTIVQYNYSHDNQGGFLLMEGGNFAGTGLIARYNLSVNDAWGGSKGVFTFADGLLQNSSIYNNTVYIASGLSSQPTYCDQWNGSTSITWNFRNNLIANFGTGTYLTPYGSTTTIDHNLFYGNHPASEPADAYKITSDPQFAAASATAPYGIGSVSGYEVSGTSPATSSGALVTGNGGLDYFGRPLSATVSPTRGFYEVVSY